MSAKWKKLVSLQEGILELRRKHASYRTIAQILRNIDVQVSHVTVRKFCLRVSKSRRRRKQPRKATGKPMYHEAHSEPQIRNKRNRAVQTRREPGGPRIADPNTI
jgi:transposase-like protein